MALTMPTVESAPTFDAQAVPDATDWAALAAGVDQTGVLSGGAVTPHTGTDMAVNVADLYAVVQGTSYFLAATTNIAIANASTSDRRDIVIFTPGIGIETSGSGTAHSAACKGVPASISSWSFAASVAPPVKPPIPSGSVLLREVYVAGSSTAITTTCLVDKTVIVVGPYALPPTGVEATDMANLQAAVNARAAAGGGTVQLPANTVYKVHSSIQTMSSVTYASGTWTVNTGSVPTVGSFIIGIGVNGRSPEVMTVNSGAKTFTTDIAPGGTITATALYAVIPGVLELENVKIKGFGSSWGGGLPLTGGSKILDSGNGISVFCRGGSPSVGGFYYSRAQLEDLSVWGTTDGSLTGAATFAGVWINANSCFASLENCDIAGHLYFGLALDYNNNNFNAHKTSFRNCGSASGSPVVGGQGGGVIMDPFNGYVSACIKFDNCVFQGCVGFGLCGVNQDPISLYSCQWNGTTTSTSYQSGTSIFVQGGPCSLFNCWSESAANLDGFFSFGTVNIVGGTYNSTTAFAFLIGSAVVLTLTNVGTENHTSGTISYNSGSIVTWNCVYPYDPAHADASFIPGVVSTSQAQGVGTYGTAPNGSPGSVYAPSLITPATAVAVTTNAGTVPITAAVANFTNSSAANMTITLATSGAVDGQQTIVRVYDFSAVAKTITWTNTENSGASVPTTSAGSTTLPKTVTFQFNGATSKWRCIASV